MNRTRITELLTQAAGGPVFPNDDDFCELHWQILERFVGLVQDETLTATAKTGWITQAARDVLAERLRQVEVEGWTPDHDDAEHDQGDLAAAAACYAMNAAAIRGFPPPRLDTISELWPWSPDWFKCVTPRRDLVKAGALILAAIEWGDRNES